MSVFDSLVGQDHVVNVLGEAVADAAAEPAGPSMTHAWLFIGPPGSGRSNAAIAFGAALACPDGGCGRCEDCRAAMAGNHPDVEVVRPEGLSYKTEEARNLVSRADMSPTRARWHVIVLEDADRLTESANNVLLKSIEEPASRTVWLLCAPSVEDLLPTVRSRCQVIGLRTPATAAVASFLEGQGVDAGTAAFAARASMGHIGRARALATIESVRNRRHDVLVMMRDLSDLASCMAAAGNIVEAAKADAEALLAEREETERADMMLAMGAGAEGKGVKRVTKAAMKELDDRHTARRNRTVRDELDRVLVDLLAWFRDVLVLQQEAPVELV
ncbi:MAG: DNA polymerase III subunit delta', partial [Candidatus Nanopelagicales bacterium]|nr:DNA polymerase III subunit delta' [Candidatus Nanopelagicales bacterium]